MPSEEVVEQPEWLALIIGSLASMAWWLPTLVPLLWAEAGKRPPHPRTLVHRRLLAGAVGLLTFTAVRAGQATNPVEDLGLPRITQLGSWLWGLGGGVAVWLVSAAVGWASLPGGRFLEAVAMRLDAAIQPIDASFGVLAAVILADELLFRGWLPRAVGHGWAAVVYAVIKAPLDPIGAVCLAGTMDSLASTAV